MISCSFNSKTPITQELLDTYFPIVHASKLTVDNKFLRYTPTTPSGIALKKSLLRLIESKMAVDFRAQVMDPSIDPNTGNVYYCEGERPAIGLSALEWKFAFKNFLPEYGSKLGTCDEHDLFLGVILDYLVRRELFSVKKAWEYVCVDSSSLGHYWDSHQALHGLEPTGRRRVNRWFDLGNTCKLTVLHEDSFIFYYIGGFYAGSGTGFPVAEVDMVVSPHKKCLFSVGWCTMPAKIDISNPLAHVLSDRGGKFLLET